MNIRCVVSPILTRVPKRGGTPPRAQFQSESHPGPGDRLRAIEQIESRALGKPKETVTTEVDESEAIRELRELTPEQRRELLHRWNDPDGGVEAVEASG